jgi:hypothetical protein
MCDNVKVVHKGRGGYVEYEGKKYFIELANNGSFYISFPSGNRHSKLQLHLKILTKFAASKNPKWHVENRTKNYKTN